MELKIFSLLNCHGTWTSSGLLQVAAAAGSWVKTVTMSLLRMSCSWCVYEYTDLTVFNFHVSRIYVKIHVLFESISHYFLC